MAASTLASLRILLGIDASGVEKPIEDTKRRISSLGQTAGRTAPNMDKLRGSLLSIATAATGVHPGLLRIGSLLSSWAVSGVIVTGAVAGIAAIGAAFKREKEKVEEFEKAVTASMSRLDELVRKRAVGGQLGTFEDLINARTRAGEIRRDIAGKEATIAGRSDILFGAANDKLRGEIGRLNAELAGMELRAAAAAKAIQEGAIPALEGLTVTAVRAKTLADMAFGAGLRDLSPTLTGRGRIAMDGSARFRRITSDNLGMGGGATDNSIQSGGLGGFLKSLFDPKQFATGLLSGGVTSIIGGLTDKLLGGLMGLFNRQSDLQQRLAEAMEQNTRALTASSDFLAARVRGAGAGDFAGRTATAVDAILNELAVGDLALDKNGRVNGRTLSQELFSRLGGFGLGGDQVGLDLAKLFRALGFGDVLNEDSLRTLGELLAKAGFAAGNLADAANRAAAALNNIPEGFKVARVRFNASEAEDAAQRSFARGGAFFLQPAFNR